MSFGTLSIARSLPRVMQAAVDNVSAEAAPSLTKAASQCNRSARYSPAAFCNSIRFTGESAARLMAARTGGGIVEAVRNV